MNHNAPTVPGACKPHSRHPTDAHDRHGPLRTPRLPALTPPTGHVHTDGTDAPCPSRAPQDVPRTSKGPEPGANGPNGANRIGTS
jgi:hypothetical protein